MKSHLRKNTEHRKQRWRRNKQTNKQTDEKKKNVEFLYAFAICFISLTCNNHAFDPWTPTTELYKYMKRWHKAISEQYAAKCEIRIAYSFGKAITFHFHWPVTTKKNTHTRAHTHTHQKNLENKELRKEKRNMYIHLYTSRKIIASTVATL